MFFLIVTDMFSTQLPPPTILMYLDNTNHDTDHTIPIIIVYLYSTTILMAFHYKIQWMLYYLNRVESWILRMQGMSMMQTWEKFEKAHTKRGILKIRFPLLKY